MAAGCLLSLMTGCSSSTTTTTPRATQSRTAAGTATPTASPAPTAAESAGNFGGTPEQLTFSWTPGFPAPAWLPRTIDQAPAAPTLGSNVCGFDANRNLYTAIIRYDPSSSAGAVTIQVQGYTGPGQYTNSGSSAPVDVEVSPPTPSLQGFSGLSQPGAAVQIASDGRSGTVMSPLATTSRVVGSISGNWRCG